MEPIPEEGGWFRRTGEGTPDATGRATWSSIVALFTAEGFSALHRLDCDEVWTWIAGDPLRCLAVARDGSMCDGMLGPNATVGARLQWHPTAGMWQAARPCGESGWSLVSCVCVPGFLAEGFELARRDEFERAYPKRGALVREFTRWGRL